MPVLLICKSDEHLIKNEVANVRTTFSPLCLWEPERASNSHVKSPIELVKDQSLMKIQTKMKSLSSGQYFPKSMGLSRAGHSHANNQNWAKSELV